MAYTSGYEEVIQWGEHPGASLEFSLHADMVGTVDECKEWCSNSDRCGGFNREGVSCTMTRSSSNLMRDLRSSPATIFYEKIKKIIQWVEHPGKSLKYSLHAVMVGTVDDCKERCLNSDRCGGFNREGVSCTLTRTSPNTTEDVYNSPATTFYERIETIIKWVEHRWTSSKYSLHASMIGTVDDCKERCLTYDICGGFSMEGGGCRLARTPPTPTGYLYYRPTSYFYEKIATIIKWVEHRGKSTKYSLHRTNLGTVDDCKLQCLILDFCGGFSMEGGICRVAGKPSNPTGYLYNKPGGYFYEKIATTL